MTKLTLSQQMQVLKEAVEKGFTYDGCTAVPDFNFGADCCALHDYYYRTTELSRAEADRLLRECMRRKGYFLLPWLYWAGVRLFGKRFYGQSN